MQCVGFSNCWVNAGQSTHLLDQTCAINTAPETFALWLPNRIYVLFAFGGGGHVEKVRIASFSVFILYHLCYEGNHRII